MLPAEYNNASCMQVVNEERYFLVRVFNQSFIEQPFGNQLVQFGELSTIEQPFGYSWGSVRRVKYYGTNSWV